MYVHGHLVAMVLPYYLGFCDPIALVCLCFGFIICSLGSVVIAFMGEMS